MADPLLEEIDRLIDDSSLSTPAAKSLRSRTPAEEVRSILQRAEHLAQGPFTIGIEILPFGLIGVVSDQRGVVHGQRRCSLPGMSVGTVVEYVARVARDLAVTSLGLDLPNPAIGIGLQLGGPVDTRTGTVILYSNHPTDPTTRRPDLPYRWRGEKLAELVEEATGCRAVLENDANAVAAYEQKFGAGQEVSSFGVILLRDGVGGSMILDGKQLQVPMELGHLVVRPGGRVCDCGQQGDIESEAGRRAIRAMTREEARISADLEWQAAVELANGEGEQADKALRAFERAGEAVALGIAALVTLHGLARVVIYAPDELIEPGKRAADAFMREVGKFKPFPPDRACRVALKPLRLTDGALGAALVALNRLFSAGLASNSPNWSTSDDLASPSPRREAPSSQSSHRA
jgi:glucokinase